MRKKKIVEYIHLACPRQSVTSVEEAFAVDHVNQLERVDVKLAFSVVHHLQIGVGAGCFRTRRSVVVVLTGLFVPLPPTSHVPTHEK